MRYPGTLPERAYAVPASRHPRGYRAAPIPLGTGPAGPLSRRHTLARRCSGSLAFAHISGNSLGNLAHL
eukprot:1206639-Prymnesium_polylepis.1